MILVESTSKDGIYYLANQSTLKHCSYKYYWSANNEDYHCQFKTLASAKCALTKLIKAMPDYKDDKIRFLDFNTLEEVA